VMPPSKRLKPAAVIALRKRSVCALARTNYCSITLRPADASPAAEARSVRLHPNTRGGTIAMNRAHYGPWQPGPYC